MPAPGATRADWLHFSVVLGLTEHLLPVVSNPFVQISPKSQLTQLGKVPSRYDAFRTVVGISKWPELSATPDQVDNWSKESDYGICIQTREVRAFDIDIDDPGEVSRVRAIIARRMGNLPARVRPGSFRCLLVFRLPGDLAKRRVERKDPAGKSFGMVELLGTGQQFIAAGRHPKGMRYEWENGLPDEIPLIEPDALEALWLELGGTELSGSADRVGRGPDQLRRTQSPGAGSRAPDPVASWLSEREWVLGSGKDDRLLIRCPWAEDHTADSGPTETVYYPAGSRGYEQGHFHCLHAHCEAREDAEFLDAIGFRLAAVDDFPVVELTLATGAVSEPEPAGAVPGGTLPDDGLPATVPAVTTAAPEPWKAGLARRKGQKGFEPEFRNVARALVEGKLWRKVAWDEFRQGLVHCGWDEADGAEAWAPLTEHLLLEGRARLRKVGFEPVGAEAMRDAVELVARRRSFDSAQEWLGRLQWDGKGRIASFLETYCGCEAGPYAQAVSFYLWTALAGRVLAPGVKADMVPILVGLQGQRKTWSLEALVPSPEFYVTVDLAVHDAETARRLRGRLVWEIADLKGLHSRDRNAIKSFVTERADTWIPKYREFAVTVPRRGVFIGTSNDDEFLDDETGNRRWLPIRVGRLERELIGRDRDQLWAEAAVAFLVDGVLWEAAEILARDVVGEFRVVEDVLEREIGKWLASEDRGSFTLSDLQLGLGHDPRESTRAKEMRLGKSLVNLGHERVRVTLGGARAWRWQARAR